MGVHDPPDSVFTIHRNAQLSGDGAGGPLLGMIVAQDLRFDVRWRHHGHVPSYRGSLDDRRGGAKIPDGRDPHSAARTNSSARPNAGADHPRLLHRSRSSASRKTSDHPAGVNPDASRFCTAHGNGVPARHASAVPGGWLGNVRRRHAGRSGGRLRHSLRRSKSGHGRSSCRSAPGCGIVRRQTTALTRHRRDRIDKRYVDERHDCRDTHPACVPSTVWGTASSRTAKF